MVRTVTIQEILRRGKWKSKNTVDRRMKKLGIEPVYVDMGYWCRHRIMLTEEEAKRILEGK
jgi:hypothetical protein